jgi:hypothetical protein
MAAVVVGLWIVAATSPAKAVIRRVYPLAGIIAEADLIVAARVSERDLRGHRATLVLGESLKGQAARARATLRLAGSDNRKQLAVLERRLPPGRLVMLFGKRGRFLLGYAEGTWFRIAAPGNDPRAPWQFVHLEPYLWRTYRGSGVELRGIVERVLRGTAGAPEPNPSLGPGYGED